MLADGQLMVQVADAAAPSIRYLWYNPIIYFCRYLQGLEQLQVPKPVKSEYGGGTKEFTIKEVRTFKKLFQLFRKVLLYLLF